MINKDEIIAKLQAENAALKTDNYRLEELLSQAILRIQELERRLDLNSSNSSKPPSSDGLKKRTVSTREKGVRKAGGQPGHDGHTLKMTDTTNVIIEHNINNCEKCQANLEHVTGFDPIKRQVFDLPEIKYIVTEHKAWKKKCACGHINCATFPKSVKAPVQYGARVKAFVTYLNNQQFVPEDRLQELFSDLFNLKISTATIANINKTFADKSQPMQDSALQALKDSKIKHLDESGLRSERQNALASCNI